MPFRREFADVPPAPADATLDPHWQALSRAGSAALLPLSYMPPVMAGAQEPWRRAAAVLLIAMFLTATAGGVCLTYGPSHVLQLIR